MHFDSVEDNTHSEFGIERGNVYLDYKVMDTVMFFLLNDNPKSDRTDSSGEKFMCMSRYRIYKGVGKAFISTYRLT